MLSTLPSWTPSWRSLKSELRSLTFNSPQIHSDFERHRAGGQSIGFMFARLLARPRPQTRSVQRGNRDPRRVKVRCRCRNRARAGTDCAGTGLSRQGNPQPGARLSVEVATIGSSCLIASWRCTWGECGSTGQALMPATQDGNSISRLIRSNVSATGSVRRRTLPRVRYAAIHRGPAAR